MNADLNALVLNADFRPVSRFPLSVWPFERTLKNVLKDRVQVLAEHDVELRSKRWTYRPPSVVALTQYVHKSERVALTRLNVFLRDEFRCQYCGGEFAARDLTFDHVVPRAAGGRDSWTNLVSACVDCNQAKGHRQDIRPKVSPREPTPTQMLRLKRRRSETYHHSWMDYLYWSGALEEE